MLYSVVYRPALFVYLTSTAVLAINYVVDVVLGLLLGAHARLSTELASD